MIINNHHVYGMSKSVLIERQIKVISGDYNLTGSEFNNSNSVTTTKLRDDLLVALFRFKYRPQSAT